MTRLEHLLTIAGEEGVEVAQRASKAKRFGMDEIKPDELRNPAGLSNAERLLGEFHDLCGVLRMLGYSDEALFLSEVAQLAIERKRVKVEAYLAYSRECGTLTEG